MGSDYNLNLWQQAKIGLKAFFNRNETIKDLFEKADTNGSGGLDKDEASAFMKKWGVGSIFQVDDVFSDNAEKGTTGVDADKSGEISLDEVISYAKQMGYDWNKDTKLKDALKGVKDNFEGENASDDSDDNGYQKSDMGV